MFESRYNVDLPSFQRGGGFQLHGTVRVPFSGDLQMNRCDTRFAFRQFVPRTCAERSDDSHRHVSDCSHLEPRREDLCDCLRTLQWRLLSHDDCGAVGAGAPPLPVSVPR